MAIGVKYPFRDRLIEFAGFDPGFSYLLPRWLFLRLVGLLGFVAFLGWFNEGSALIGPSGILPADLRQALFVRREGLFWAVFHTPSLLWLNASSGAIRAIAALGMAASLSMFLNILPRAASATGWVLYLSLAALGGEFVPAQVDELLLEILFLSAFFAPSGVRPGLGRTSPPHRLLVFATRCLIFRLMFESGLTKLLSGDPKWFDGTVMQHFYETSPCPTALAYHLHWMPHWWHVLEILVTFSAELVAPLLAVAGRRPRLVAIAIWLVFQSAIQASVNFGWLNVAAMAAALLLLDDQLLARLASAVRLERLAAHAVSIRAQSAPPGAPHVAVLGVFALYFYATVIAFATDTLDIPRHAINAVLSAPYLLVRPFMSANGYSLYGITGTHRTELVFEGSDDGGKTWRAYPARTKIQAPDRTCGLIAPYFARFDATWEIQGHRPEPAQLFPATARKLLEGNVEVLALFSANPFPEHPPRAIRFALYDYRFTPEEEWRRSGEYWRRRYLKDFLPVLMR